MLAECATAVACRIATYLELGSHTRLARTSQRFAAICALRAASPVEVTLSRPIADLRLRPISRIASASSSSSSQTLVIAAFDPKRMLRHYRPLRLTCWCATVGSDLDFLAHQSQLRSLYLHVGPAVAVGGDDGIKAHVQTLDFLARTPELESLCTDVACWRRDVALADKSRLAAATALTELRLTDTTDLRPAWRRETERPADSGSLRWATPLSRLETLELRCAPDLQTFSGLGGGSDRSDGEMAAHVAAPVRLRSLEVRDIEIACDVAPLQRLSALRSLTLGTRWSSTPIVGLAQLPVELRRLRLDTTTTTDIALLRHLTQLTHLACACGAAVLSLKPLAALGRLHVLQLTHCLAVRSLDGLECLTRLERLTLEGATILEDCMAIASLPRLAAFTLTDLCEPELHDNMPSLPHLMHLSVHWFELHDPFFDALMTDGTLVERILGYSMSSDDGRERLVAIDSERPPRTTTVVVNDGTVANVRLPPGSPVRVFTAAEYDASLGRATHEIHQHALVQRVVCRVADAAVIGAATTDETARDASDDELVDLCDRCARQLAEGANEWTCVPCDFHLCERCAAATRNR